MTMRRLMYILAVLASQGAIAQQWNSELDDALKIASVSHKKVLLYFSAAGSCDSCRNLEEKVFSSEVFNEAVSKKYVLVREDFAGNTPEDKARHLMIVEKYNRDGFFPFVVVLDANGKILKKCGAYDNESANAYLRQLESH